MLTGSCVRRGGCWQSDGTDEVALGVFTHRTTYLPGLLGSLRKIGDPPCVVVCADGPINANMARLWEAFKRTTGAVLGLPG